MTASSGPDEFSIGDRVIGRGAPCYVIAEAGVNHNGDVDTAHRLIDAAADSGADAVKFQLFTPHLLASPDAPKAKYQVDPRRDETQLAMLERVALSSEAHQALFVHCTEVGVTYLTSVFDEEACEQAISLGVNALKIPSGELTNHGLLRHVASKSLPLIVSTGMATLAEVEDAMKVLRGAEVALLHCVSSYPAPVDDANLRAMATLAGRFDRVVGFSDHTLGTTVAIAAAALGARLIEKHLTLDREAPGPDQRSSLEPSEFRTLVNGIREVESSLGDGVKRPMPSEADITTIARKSLVAARDIAPGSRLAASDVAIKRPATGIPISMSSEVIGRVAKVAISAGTPLTQEMLE